MLAYTCSGRRCDEDGAKFEDGKIRAMAACDATTFALLGLDELLLLGFFGFFAAAADFFFLVVVVDMGGGLIRVWGNKKKDSCPPTRKTNRKAFFFSVLGKMAFLIAGVFPILAAEGVLIAKFAALGAAVAVGAHLFEESSLNPEIRAMFKDAPELLRHPVLAAELCAFRDSVTLAELELAQWEALVEACDLLLSMETRVLEHRHRDDINFDAAKVQSIAAQLVRGFAEARVRIPALRAKILKQLETIHALVTETVRKIRNDSETHRPRYEAEFDRRAER